MAKYTDSVNLLRSDLSPELTMEILGAELWNVSKLYFVNKSKDFRGPMSIFSEANQGEVAVEGTLTDKLEMRPHCGIEEYGKLCQERNRKHVAEARRLDTHRSNFFSLKLPEKALENCCGLHLISNPVMVKKKTASVKLKWRSRSSRGKVEVKILTTETDMEAASSRNQPTRGILERNTERALCVQWPCEKLRA
ncbi:unnamed protein product [Microthlaspi erraticum]|uniref:Uncharacterized protein n=1 Tax=Microthlaspi erraticum TaxID=1685480 RepID=A0A6D2IVA3_9BRAS|nr:unnamed protein product [Microthlaspi erraticum]